MTVVEALRPHVSVLPGLALTTAIAWMGLQAGDWLGRDVLGFERSPVSGIMMAIVAGLIAGNLVSLPAWTRAGVKFSVRRVLRLGIILLGIRLGLGDMLRLGLLGIPVIALCLIGAILFTHWLSARLALSVRIGTLVAVGTSICGATAIVATAPAIDAREEETAYAIANITLFGILAMFLYPYLARALFAGDATSAGLFLGTSIHETAQVAGSGLIYADLFGAPRALDVATVTKLVRNVMMAGVIPLMAYLYQSGRQRGASAPSRPNVISLVPLFILGFLLLVGVRTIGDLTLAGGAAWGLFDASEWNDLTRGIVAFAEILLAVAMAGVGLGTQITQLRRLGLRPLLAGLGASAAVGLLSLAGIMFLRLAGLR